MTGTLFPNPRLRAVSSSGNPVPGARLFVYRAGTTVLAETFTSSALTVAHANPHIANSAGEFAAIYLDPDSGYDYRFVCQTDAGVQLWAEDNVPAGAASSGDGGGTGTDGSDGLSVAEVRIYQRSETPPTTPSGGSYSFATQSLSAPDGWSVTIPEGSSPIYVSTAVAAAEGIAGVDSILEWSAPVVMARDGQSVNIVFQRAAAQPATPAPSTGVPFGWYDDVASVPASADTLWSSVGTRDNASLNWVWQLPIQVEGDQGPAGTDASLYYIKPTSGTAIKNGSGTLTVEARKVFAGNDVLLSSGDIQLYNGSTALGYTETFDSTAIAGSVLVTMKDGPSGNVYDSITLVDVVDGAVGGVGTDAVFGYIEASNGLAWVRGADGTTWTPSATTTQLNCTFVQGGAEVARVAHVITRDSSGILTGAAGTHSGGDLNGARVTVAELNESTQAMTVTFTYSFSGDVTKVSETVLTSVAGAGTQGDPGDPGTSATYITLSAASIPLFAYQNGLVPSYASAGGVATVWNGDTDVTATSTLSISASSNVTGATINAAGAYSISALNADNGSITIQAVYGGQTVTTKVQFFKQYAGYEIVGSLPQTNLFLGRVVFLESDAKLYRYNGSSWTRKIIGEQDIEAGSVTTDALFAGTITTAKLRVTQLSVLSTNAGTITAGTLQSPSGNSRFDLTNARIIYNSAPGQTGGFVRVQGGGFGPSGNYLDWYGPKPAGQTTDSGIVANLTDANAYYYLKTNGEQRSVAQRIRGEFEPKMWVVFDGRTTNPPTIQDRYNVASVTRTATGSYRITFAEALANVNYVLVGSCDNTLNPIAWFSPQARTTSYCDIQCRTGSDAQTLLNCDYVAVIAFGSNVPGSSNVTQPLGGVGGGTIGWGNLPSNTILP